MDKIWQQIDGAGPLVATAVHDGHDVRDDVAEMLALPDAGRLREEDPHTGKWTSLAPTRVIGTRSRFEVDLNRPRESAVYRVPEDAWGLKVWKDNPAEQVFQRSLAEYDRFYAAMNTLLQDKVDAHGYAVVYDLHTYNHRREGPTGPLADPEANPQVNIGTRTLDREHWGPVIDAFIDGLRAYDYPGGALDVRENVKFFGGNWPRWIHGSFPESVVAISIEFKKYFMDEWSGEPDREHVDAIGKALRSTVPAVLAAVQKLPGKR